MYRRVDRRRNYYMVIDVETANGLGQPMVYDIGFAVMDTQGRIYEKRSYVVQEIFFDEKKIYYNHKMMGSAYYADKLPQYYKGIFETHDWECKPMRYIQKVIESMCEHYNVKAICAYNAQFDTRALRATVRYVTKSETAEFLPNYPIHDIWVMACQTIGQQTEYARFCYENQLYSKANNCLTKAETMWAYLTDDASFEEEHTGLADVLIECAIMAKALEYRKPIRKEIEPMPWKLAQPNFHKYLEGIA